MGDLERVSEENRQQADDEDRNSEKHLGNYRSAEEGRSRSDGGPYG